MLSRRAWILALVIGGVGIVVAAAAVVVRSLAPAHGPQGTPKAVVDKSPWDSGVIERLEESDHTFVIRNEGDAPLELANGGTSCSCTLAELPEQPIPPGGEARVRIATKHSYLEEHDKLKAGRLLRAVRLLTNDPEQERLRLEILCTVVRPLDAEPPSVALWLNPSVAPSEANRTAATVVYSQTWDKFDLAAGKCSVAGVKWRIAPAEPAALAPLGGKSGYRLEFSLSPDMPEGQIKGSLELSARPVEKGDCPDFCAGTRSARTKMGLSPLPDPKEPTASESPRKLAASPAARRLNLPIEGRVSGRVTITGRNVRGERTLDLGTLKAGESLSTFFLLKVNDEHKSLSIKQIETNPDFLHVRLAPSGGAPQFGLYRFEVDLAHAPACNFLSTAGFIRLKTDHPRLPVVNVRVEMAVCSGA